MGDGTGPGARGDDDPARDRREDEEDLRALSVAYASAVDDRDGVRFAELFVADGALVVPRYPEELEPVVTRVGTEALRTIPEGLRRFDRTFHQVTNGQFTVEGDRASGEVQCTAHHLTATGRAGGPPGGPGPEAVDSVWFIRYRDEYVRTPTGWRITRPRPRPPMGRGAPCPRMAAGPRPGAQRGGTGWGGGGPT